jgi:hypothetical protein
MNIWHFAVTTLVFLWAGSALSRYLNGPRNTPFCHWLAILAISIFAGLMVAITIAHPM